MYTDRIIIEKNPKKYNDMLFLQIELPTDLKSSGIVNFWCAKLHRWWKIMKWLK